ncbi:hypothetical protein SEPCBS119000_001842 [Sporothrix epigloea]|uniref:Rhodopsin domain-containing protein n=1 Tax=Sporothrix epigloea TaxID=1892477 RepID=A0ABP0DE59_9PEZI
MAPQDYGPALLGGSVLMLVLTTLAIVMRMSVRLGVLGGLGWDDALVSVSWVFAMVLFVTNIVSKAYGVGMHLNVVPINERPTANMLILIASMSYSLSGPAVKAAFSVLYLRILRGRHLAMANKCLIGLFAAQALTECSVKLFQCHPIQKDFYPSMQGHCYKLLPMRWFSFSFNLITELILFLQPIPTIWHLQVPVAKRVGIIAMLSLGLLVCVISIVRVIYVITIDSDTTYDFPVPMIWSEVEVGALILCSCIPYTRQVIQRIPWLSRRFGLPPVGSSSGTPRNRHGSSKSAGRTLSIALQNRLQKSAGVVSVPLPSQVDSTDDILHHRAHVNPVAGPGDHSLTAKAAAAGAIMVTHNIKYEYDYGGWKGGKRANHEGPGARTIVYTGQSLDEEDDGESAVHPSDASTEYTLKDAKAEETQDATNYQRPAPRK